MHENDYLETQVMTAPGPKLHMMVIEGALRHARLAHHELSEKNFEGSHENLNRAREFVSELISGLNPEVAPEMVGSLKLLFAVIYRSLALADIEHDPSHINEAINLLTSHRDAWTELLTQLPQESPPPTSLDTEPGESSGGFDWQG